MFKSKRLRWSAAIAVICGLVTTGYSVSSADEAQRGGSVTPEHISTVVRWNASDDDAQVWITAKNPELAMATITVRAPNGRTMFSDQLDPRHGHGQEVVEVRSSEHTVEGLKKIYPTGEYRWSGRTVDGRRIKGTTRLTFELPGAPTIAAPADGATDVPVDGAVVRWDQIPNAQWIFVEVEAVGDGRELLVRLEGTATELSLPPGLLLPGTEYEVELKAVHTNGNQAARDSAFTTT